MRIGILLLVVFIVAACSNPGSGTGANPLFDSFKLNFHPMELPIAIKGCYIEPSKYTELHLKTYPGFVRDSDNELAYCSFKTNGDYVGIITLGPADCYFPMLSTYDQGGKKIDEKNIVIGGCGSDCGFACEEYMTLRADYTLYTSDTVTYFKCDTAGDEIPGTREHYIIYKKGKLLPSGKIELSDEIKEPLKD